MTSTQTSPLTEATRLQRVDVVFNSYLRGELGPVNKTLAVAVDPDEERIYTARGVEELFAQCESEAIRKRLIIASFGADDLRSEERRVGKECRSGCVRET